MLYIQGNMLELRKKSTRKQKLRENSGKIKIQNGNQFLYIFFDHHKNTNSTFVKDFN